MGGGPRRGLERNANSEKHRKTVINFVQKKVSVRHGVTLGTDEAQCKMAKQSGQSADMEVQD